MEKNSSIQNGESVLSQIVSSLRIKNQPLIFTGHIFNIKDNARSSTLTLACIGKTGKMFKVEAFFPTKWNSRSKHKAGDKITVKGSLISFSVCSSNPLPYDLDCIRLKGEKII